MAKKTIRPIRIEGNIAYVPLTKGYEAVIDAADVPLVEGRSWYAKTTPCATYAAWKGSRSGVIYMHRAIAGAAVGQIIDHMSGDGLDNRKGNLRVATPSQNQFNKARNKNSRSGYKGVSQCPYSGMWRARIKKNRREHYIGTFSTAEDAALAYRAAAQVLHGHFARCK